ncbi:UPF0392 protein F13G3.3 [Elysia marginata]|uniref:UPF0392 protein F13G3.3 n=1 Tax=Elysia marginata TaxID=1093978 RepID=A0AAV4FK54_9GAST|nr:UPF0392 protein F13G3.3 [Elysia marginata]
MALCSYKTLRHCLSRFLFILAVSYILCLLSLLRLDQYSHQLHDTATSTKQLVREIRQPNYHTERTVSNNFVKHTRKLQITGDSRDFTTTRFGVVGGYKTVLLRRLKETRLEQNESRAEFPRRSKSSKRSQIPSASYSYNRISSIAKSGLEARHMTMATKMPKKTIPESLNSVNGDSPPVNCSNQDRSQAAAVTESIVHFQSLGDEFYVYGAYLDDRFPPDIHVRLTVLRPAKYTTKSNSPTSNGEGDDDSLRGNNEDSEQEQTTFKIWCHFSSSLVSTDFSQNLKNTIHIRAKTFTKIKVQATAYEMCENHSKKYGGWIYSCPVPSRLVNLTVSPSIFPHTVTLVRTDFRYVKDISTLENIQLLPLKKDLKEHMFKTNSGGSRSGEGNQRRDTATHISLLENIAENGNVANTGHSLDSKDNAGTRNTKDCINQSKDTSESTKRESQKPCIGVCVPPMYGALPLHKLINFIELCSILGADKVFLYSHDSPEILLRYLRHYTGPNPGVLSLVRWNIPLIPQKLQAKEPDLSTKSATSSTVSDSTADQPQQLSLENVDMDEPPSSYSDQTVWNHGQLLAVQHCLYSNMADYDWLLFMDIDEMLVPKNVSSWPELIQQNLKDMHFASDAFTQDKLAGFSFQSAFFQQDFRNHVTNSIDYFQFLHRTQQTSSKRSKMLVRPRRVFELGIHHLSKPVVVSEEEKERERDKHPKDLSRKEKDSTVYKVPPSTALIHHYRKCVQDPDEADVKNPSDHIRGSAWTDKGWVPLENLEGSVYGDGRSNFECNILVKDDTLLKYEAALTIISRNVTNSAMNFFAGES